MNAVMHAAGASNIPFFKVFHKAAKSWKDEGFNFNQKNKAGRNVHALTTSTEQNVIWQLK